MTPTALVVALALAVPKTPDQPSLVPVPGSPAFEALGGSPTEILRPGSLSAFTADLLSGVDAQGKLASGFAVEAAPLWLWTGPDVTMEGWRKDYWARFSSRFTVSAGTVSEEGGALSAAVGLRAVLWDPDDPRWSDPLVKCIQDALRTPPAGGGTADELPPSGDEPPTTRPNPGVLACKQRWLERHTLASGAAAAFAVVGTSPDRKLSSLDGERYIGWLSAARRATLAGNAVQGIASARYAYAPDTRDHELLAGAAARWGSPRLAGSLQASWSSIVHGGELDESTLIVGGVVEVRLAQGVWLELSPSLTAAGRGSGTWVSTAGLRYGLSPTPPAMATR